MGLFQTINLEARKRELQFLVRGGLDAENLVRANKVDLRSDKVRQIFLKYGNLELYEKISRACAE